MKWSIKSLLLATMVIGLAIATVRAYVFPETLRVHIVAPGEYQINGKDITTMELENRFSSQTSKRRFRSNNSFRLEVTLPPGAALHEFETETDKLRLLGARAGFTFMKFSRGITE